MAYNKTTWINGVTVADEDNMNNIENGIKSIDNQLNQSTLNNVDANDFKTSGFYYLGTGCQNVPDNYIKLIVNGNVDVSQIAIHVDGSQPIMFIRSFDGTNWSSWQGLKKWYQYSTSEVKTDDVWINGKPIYRKVIDNMTMSNATQTVNTGISNLENVIKMDAYVKYSATTYSAVSAGYVFNYSAGVITISPLSNFLNLSSYTGYIIIEYTKTTD